ncbi:MAG: radical protein [Bacteroidetes bacterium]|nr:radical protein [Bacteroidota bacterium]
MQYNRKFDQVFGSEKIDCFYSVALKITTKCCFSCEFCCEKNYEKDSKNNDSDWQDIVKLLINHGTKRFCITGGEPLLYADFANIIEEIKNNGGYVSVCTASGYHFIDKIKPISKYVDFIRFSMHGERKYHDKITNQKGAYNNLIEAIHLAQKINLPFSISSVITNDLIPQIEQFIQNAISLNAKKIDFFPVLKSGNGLKYLKTNDFDLNQAKKIILKLKNQYQSEIIINYYEYEWPECILVYRNGDVVIDPVHDEVNYQLTIGNIFKNDCSYIWDTFSKKHSNNQYLEHLKK